MSRDAGGAGSALAAAGLGAAFGLVGSGNFRFVEELVEAGVPYTSARHETGAVAMADGYSRSTGQVGLATVHQGPGFTNALTGLVEVSKSGSAVILAVPETPSTLRQSNFLLDQAGIADAAGAVVVRCADWPSQAAAAAAAWEVATTGAAVVLHLPLGAAPTATIAAGPIITLDETVDALTAAARPLLIAGRGAVAASAIETIRTIGEATGSLLATTAQAHGAFDGDPFDLGVAGGFASPAARRLIPQADVVVAFGASLTRWTTLDGSLFAPDALVVRIDDHSARAGAESPVSARLLEGDAAQQAARILERLEGGREVRETWRTPATAALIEDGSWEAAPFTDRSDASSIDPRTLTAHLAKVLPRARTTVVDAGHFSGWPMMLLPGTGERSVVFNQAFQSVGLGLGATIGAAIGREDRLAVCAIGDGGLLMSLGDLESAVRSGRPILVVVYDDQAYGAEIHHFDPTGDVLDAIAFPKVDFAGIARAMGAEGITVVSSDDLRPLARWLAAPTGVFVVDAKVTRAVVGKWLMHAFAGEKK